MRTRIANAMRASARATERNDRVCISDAAQLANMKRRRELLAELEAGIAQRTIGLGYQPKVNLASGQFIGAETLLRWHHETLGPIPAQEAITIAEDHDLIDDLTLYIFDRVMAELRSTLKARPDFKVAINFSARTLTRRSLADDVALMLSKHEISGRNIIIEVTESILLDEDRTRQTIADLIDLGVQFSIDDFGTGYSNLEYIKQLPSAELKIDRRFVKSLGVSGDGEELVRGTIELAHSVSKKVVAEGVETKETADRLRAMGCDMAQGHYFSHAVSAGELDELLGSPRLAA
jgi:EAL domain-containing protein (putative c-di-GMP-specific phosphodiesterase class I)